MRQPFHLILHLTDMRKLFYGILALAGLVFATSCEGLIPGGLIVDWAPVEITIEAYDAAGNSIISPDMPGMTLTFRNEVFRIKQSEPVTEEGVQTKAYAAIMDGLIARPIQDEQGKIAKYILWFGEIDGAKNMDEDILLHWPDGSEDTIHYHCGNHREWPEPKCDRSWKLNGAKHEGSNFIFHDKSLPAE